jgi:ABC-2 type transport system permease protein
MDVWSTFVAMFWKEWRGSIRRRVWGYLILSQVIEIAAIAWLDSTIREMPIVLVDRDHTAESRTLAERLQATHAFKIAYITTSTEQARSHIRAGRAKAAVVIPPEYGRARGSGNPAELLMLVDGSDASVSSQATAALEGLTVQITSEGTGRKPLLDVRSTLLFNPGANQSWFVLPGLMALLLGNRWAYEGLNVAEAREAGNLERLLMTPMNNSAFLLGQIAPYVVLIAANGLVYLVVMRFVLGVPMRGEVVALIAGLVLYSMSMMALSSMIAAGAKTYDQAVTNYMMFNLPAMMLSGYVFPLSAVPKFLLPISYAMPQTHFIEICRGISLRGSSVPELGLHFGFLALSSIVFMVAATWRFSVSLTE